MTVAPSRARSAFERSARTPGWLSLVLSMGLAACGGEYREASTQAEARGMAPAVADQRLPPAFAPAQPQAPASGNTAPEAEMLQVKQQLAELRHEIEEIRKQLLRSGMAPQTANPGPDPRRDAEARAEADQVEQRRAASAETAFRTESLDARWSLGTAAAIRAALSASDETVGEHVRSVECRSQTCRVEINAEANANLERNMPLLLGRLGSTLANVTAARTDQGDGRQATVLYLSR